MTVDHLVYLARWIEELHRPSVKTTFTRGPDDRPKRAAWATIEGPAAAGQVTLWDTGEVELEAYDYVTLEPILAESARVQTEWELDALLSRLLAVCERS